MAPEPSDTSTTRVIGERRQALWPWLLMPLVALLLFFALYRVRHAPPPASRDVPSMSPAPSESGTP